MNADTPILLVEDDKKVGPALQAGLTENGFDVTLAHSCADAEDRMTRRTFALMILDLGLPDRDGLDFLRDLRQQGIRTPVLILTARDAVDERVLGLDTGADDYLAKPFAFSELLARLRALTRRVEGPGPNVLCVGDLTINLLNRSVDRQGRTLDLSPREFDVLAYLAHKADTTVSRETLMREVWKVKSRASSMDNVIDVLMARLREKVDKEFQPSRLVTVRGVGYRLRVTT